MREILTDAFGLPTRYFGRGRYYVTSEYFVEHFFCYFFSDFYMFKLNDNSAFDFNEEWEKIKIDNRSINYCDLRFNLHIFVCYICKTNYKYMMR